MLPNNFNNKIAVVVLAAGEGKRMGSTLPKVMHALQDKPLIDHVVGQVEALSLTRPPVVVVNPKHTYVQDHLGSRADYAVQSEQLGTGHAVACAEPMLGEGIEHVIVLYGDMPFVTAESIQRLVANHAERGNILTLMTATVPDFAAARKPLHSFGRIIRDDKGNIIRSVELKDATPEEAQIREVNPCYYCFAADWLWPNLKKLKNTNQQGEYYLTDLVGMAIVEGQKISSIAIDPQEALGVNTPEDLMEADRLKQKHISAGGIVYRYGSAGQLEILLMHRVATNTYHLPKGTQEPGETLEDTARREIREETGADVALEGYVTYAPSSFERDGKVIQKETYYFAARYVAGNIGTHDTEHDTVDFFAVPTACQLLSEHGGDKLGYENEALVCEAFLRAIGQDATRSL